MQDVKFVFNEKQTEYGISYISINGIMLWNRKEYPINIGNLFICKCGHLCKSGWDMGCCRCSVRESDEMIISNLVACDICKEANDR